MKTLTLSKDGDVCELTKHDFVGHPNCAWLRTLVFTCFALMAFAANSILCRLALGTAAIDPAGFTALRLVSGAVVLWLLMHFRRSGSRHQTKAAGSWVSAGMLFFYAVAFSFAFVGLQAGTGALILFGAVQATMIITAILRGERPGGLEYTGLAIALAGLAYLVLPGLQAPSPLSAGLMAMAGTSWGIYTLRGRGAVNPVAATADNFKRSVLLLLLIIPWLIKGVAFSAQGILLAAISGGLTSALGYVIWYAALPSMTTSRAALVQLLVPVLAAGGGILFLSEPLTLRLLLAAAMILGGIALAITGRKTNSATPPSNQTV